ncbi:MAG: hypothetical protein IBX56_19225 [Methylomicrobium sp.]|nr:hypothetical protein [Methylomicrobium sp.]
MKKIKRKIVIDDVDEQTLWCELHFQRSNGNVLHLIALLDSDIELTRKTRKFISEVLSGTIKAKRPAQIRSREKENYFRDLFIFDMIEGLLHKNATLTLASSKTAPGAAALAAERYLISENNALKIYRRMLDEEKNIKDNQPFNPEDHI